MKTMLPCPFCGEPGYVVGSDFLGKHLYYAACTSLSCFCCIGEAYDSDACPDHKFTTEQDAANAWNKRVTK